MLEKITELLLIVALIVGLISLFLFSIGAVASSLYIGFYSLTFSISFLVITISVVIQAVIN